ncbi:hypothetical protein RD792_001069 [Penstemon davidsonii]|uniref:GRAM domain-containing protein n=1 Tax=Penstemon davidsonii TaxID=160366 RepID=A0ABR0DNJ3_9LAMI|nr:hypothetical protein RD792_001069 [Penstemon davidsonii]
MEQPTNSKEDNNAEGKKSVSPGKASSPIRTPDSDPKPEIGAIKPGDNADNTTIDIDLNESNRSTAENNKKSSPQGGLKSKKSVRWSEELVMESPRVPREELPPIPRYSGHGSSNPYVNYSPAPTTNSSSFNLKESMDSVKGVLGRWGKKVGEATKRAEDLAGNTWQHLKTSPSLTDAALGRIAQGTKVLAEGGYEKIFRQTFETVPEEQMTNSYACYLSTSGGPVMGVLYLSTAKLAFCSDSPLSYQAGDKTEWSYYKGSQPGSHEMNLR